MEGHTHLCRRGSGTLTANRYQNEILGLTVRFYIGPLSPGLLLVRENSWPHVARAYRQFMEDQGINAIDCPHTHMTKIQ